MIFDCILTILICLLPKFHFFSHHALRSSFRPSVPGPWETKKISIFGAVRSVVSQLRYVLLDEVIGVIGKQDTHYPPFCVWILPHVTNHSLQSRTFDGILQKRTRYDKSIITCLLFGPILCIRIGCIEIHGILAHSLWVRTLSIALSTTTLLFTNQSISFYLISITNSFNLIIVFFL